VTSQLLGSHVQESKALHADLEERSKAEAASGDKLNAKMQRLEVDFVCVVPYFLWRAFKLSISSLTGLCIGRQAQTGRRGTLAKIHCIGTSSSCGRTVAVLYLSHVCMNIKDVHRI
jgi:hypothetical protein